MSTSPILPDRLAQLDTLQLKQGNHNSFARGACLLEAVSWIAGEEWSDHPACVDRALGAFGRRFNDRLRDDERQLLKPLIPRLVGTAGSIALMRRRAFLLVDRHVRTIVPMMLRELKRPEQAAELEAIHPIVDDVSARAARECARRVRDVMRSADAAYAAADAADAAYAAAAYAADAAAAAADAAYADAAYAAYAAAAYADAAYAADAAAYAAADAAAAAAAYAAAAKSLRGKVIAASIASFVEAIELTEAV